MYQKIIILCLIVFTFFSCEKEVDTTGPVYVSSNPAKNATKVPLNTVISITFDKDVVVADNHTIKVNGVVVKAKALAKVVTIETALKSGTVYVISIPSKSILDANGNSVKPMYFSFKTDFEVFQSLATPNPIPQAVNVYNYFRDNYGKKSLSSIMDFASCEWVNFHTKKFPAIMGTDFIFLHTTWTDYSNITEKENYWNAGGLITTSWHWNVPITEGSTEYSFRPFGLRTDGSGTKFDITKATTAGTWENRIVLADLNKLVPIFKKMQDKGIPVLWRPLHEAAGAWFWWGYKGPQPCINLWRMMFNHFKDNGVRNLIWIWTAEADPNKGTNDFSWYPGDEYVDIIGTDIYDKTDPTYMSKRFQILQELYPSKMIALSEFGNVTRMSQMWAAGAKWSFFMSWAGGGSYTNRDHSWAPVDWWDDAFAKDYVITRDEMPVLK